ncbi:MAG: alpha/beta hydrolase-fold protein [Kiritimatiellia bacterium]|nr:alpha/beta hydrolase-fold protein [Kiritimatiellia bacterium]
MSEFKAIEGICDTLYADVESRHVGDTYRIFVSRPQVHHPGNKCPVLYALDGNGSYAIAESIRMMSLGLELPQMYVVSIGYPVDSFAETMAIRTRDLTPNTGGQLEATTLLFAAGGDDRYRPGGGEAFLRFLCEELRPMIEDQFDVDPNDSILGGASLGGLFPTWVLLNQPESFNRYLCISPSIWWNDEEVWQWESAYAEQHDDLQAEVFFSAGGLEMQDLLKEQVKTSEMMPPEARDAMVAAYDEFGWPRMAEITPEITEKLASRGYPGLKVHCYNMPHETHLSVFIGAMLRGLRVFYAHWQIPAG